MTAAIDVFLTRLEVVCGSKLSPILRVRVRAHAAFSAVRFELTRQQHVNLRGPAAFLMERTHNEVHTAAPDWDLRSAATIALDRHPRAVLLSYELGASHIRLVRTVRHGAPGQSITHAVWAPVGSTRVELRDEILGLVEQLHAFLLGAACSW